MNRLVLIISLLFCVLIIQAQRDVRVGLFQDRLLNSFVFHCIKGEYNVVHDRGEIRLNEGDLLYLSCADSLILVSDGDLNFGYYDALNFVDQDGNGEFRIRPVDPAGEAGNYEGELELRLNHKSFLPVNIIDMNKYLAGVVETEGGPSAHPEYYKAQSVLCRTYAVKNFNSHQTEGFNLCDHTHCQAYKGVNTRNPEIWESVLNTHNLLLTGRLIALVNAVYHSNSGGETQRASDIWTNGAEHLQSVIDPFSLDQPNAKWERVIPLENWRNYLFSQTLSAALTAPAEELLIKQQHRRRYFVLKSDTLRIDRIRADFNLRSGFFDMEMRGEAVVMKGKGYGHGVGMSQEGAMNMAKQGFTFSDILRFYYHQIQIRDIMDIPDSSLPEEFR